MNYGRRTSFKNVRPKRECPSESSDIAGSDQDTDERGGIDDESKRRTRNMSEKKRRDQFNVLISELGTLVGSKNKKMDKTSVLRSTIQLLKHHNALQSPAHEIQEDWKPASLTNEEFTQLMLEAIGGFLLIFSESGVILYVSESVSPLLGYTNNELVNQNLFDMLAPHERSSTRAWVMERQIYTNPANMASTALPEFLRFENQIQLQCHLRCGRGIGGGGGSLETIYRLVEIRGCFRVMSESTRVLELSDMLVENDKFMFCCITRVVGQPIVREIAFIPEVGVREFTTRHSMEWKYLFMDQRGPSIIGYLPFEVLGTSGFDYLHPDDLTNVARFLRQLRKTGEVTSCFYRFMTKGIQWIWLQSRAHINYNQWNSKPEFITSVNVLASEDQVRSAVTFLDANDNDISESQCGDSQRTSTEEDFERETREESTPIISSTVRTPPDCGSNGNKLGAPALNGDATATELQAAHVDLPYPNTTTSETAPVTVHLSTAQHQLFSQLRSKHAHIRAIMRRQQAQLDRVSRVLSLAEKGQLQLESPCGSPTPNSPTPNSPTYPVQPPVSSTSSIIHSSVRSSMPPTEQRQSTTQHQPPEHQLPQHQPPQHQPSQHQTPQHQPSQHQTPQHQPPQHQAPQHQPPQHQPPQHQPPQQHPKYPHQQHEEHMQPHLERLLPSPQQYNMLPQQPQAQDFQTELPILQTYTDEVMPEVDQSVLSMILPCWSSSLPP